MTISNLKIYHDAIEMLYGCLVLNDSKKIISALLKYEKIRSKDLPKKAHIEKTNMFNITKRLTDYNILQREKINSEVYYSLSYFAKNVLELTDDFIRRLDEAREKTITTQDKQKITKLRQKIRSNLKDVSQIQDDSSRDSLYTTSFIKDVPGQ